VRELLLDELDELLAGGVDVAFTRLLPARPVSDADPAVLWLAWRRGTLRPIVRAFTELTRRLAREARQLRVTPLANTDSVWVERDRV
jgi:hypothetical protein